MLWDCEGGPPTLDSRVSPVRGPRASTRPVRACVCPGHRARAPGWASPYAGAGASRAGAGTWASPGRLACLGGPIAGLRGRLLRMLGGRRAICVSLRCLPAAGGLCASYPLPWALRPVNLIWYSERRAFRPLNPQVGKPPTQGAGSHQTQLPGSIGNNPIDRDFRYSDTGTQLAAKASYPGIMQYRLQVASQHC